jgi:signal transduction histidine kinase
LGFDCCIKRKALKKLRAFLFFILIFKAKNHYFRTLYNPLDLRLLPIIVLFALSCTSLFAQYSKDSAYTYQELNKLLDLARNNNDNKTMAEVYVKLGDYEGDIFAEYEKSLKYYNWALDHFKATKDSIGIIETNHAIARRYKDAGLYNESIQILQGLAKIYDTHNKPNKLARVYFDLNQTFKARGDHETSIEYLRKAMDINQILKDTTLQIALLFDNIQSFEVNYELDSALITAYKAFNISTTTNNREIAAKSLFHIGYINKLKNDYQKSIKYLSKSQYILPYQPYSEIRKNIYKELADVYSKIGHPNKAYQYLRQYTLLNDSILNKNRQSSFANLALKYGTKEKQTSIELLKIEKEYEISKNNAQRRTLYILAIGLFIVLTSIYFIIKFYDQRISSAKIITEQKEEINQQKIRELEDNMKMNSMRSVIEGQETERERIAKDLHDSLGGLLSTIKLQFDQVSSKNENLHNMKEYGKAYQLLDTAVEEVRTISRDLQPGSLQNLGLIPAIKDLVNRFEGENNPDIDFQYYNIPEKLDKMISLSIYRIIQELLNNSLKHAQANEILIQINSEDNELVIQYEDDGVGFDQNNLKRKGMGLENIKSRVNYMHGNINIESENAKGMAVMIRLKYL